MRSSIRNQTIKVQVSVGMEAGARAASMGKPITACPFGVCKGLEDEFHDDVLISSWAIGWSETMMLQASKHYFTVGVDFSFVDTEFADVSAQFLPTGCGNRLREAMVDGFTRAVIICDFGGVMQ